MVTEPKRCRVTEPERMPYPEVVMRCCLDTGGTSMVPGVTEASGRGGVRIGACSARREYM